MSDVPNDARLYAPATERNRAPILEVLRGVLPQSGLVLEIASGTGQHITYFAPHFPQLIWQPSDPTPEYFSSLVSWCDHLPSPNLLPPIELDARHPHWPIKDCAAILCINMIHIAPWTAGLGLLAGAGRVLGTGGMLYLYGPFKQGGQHTAPSNEEFDRNLQAQDPNWGVRDLEEVIRCAQAQGLALAQVLPMPANNLSVIFHKL